MNPHNRPATEGRRARPSVAQMARIGLALIALTLCAANVNAQEDLSARMDGPADAVPWIPDVIQVADPYSGATALDHFAGPNSADQVGRLTAQLSNGDRLVVGLVPQFGQGNSPTGYWNLGLVRYNASNQRVPWSGPGVYGFYGDQYVVYPNTNQPFYKYVRDVKVRNGFIYVLVDEVTNQARTDLGRQDVRIVSFREDGSFASQWRIFGAAPEAVDHVDFYGAQMVVINPTRMIVAATAYDATGPFIAVTRLEILSNGAVSLDDDWGFGYGGEGSLNRWITYFPPVSFCGGGGAAGRCDVTAYYASVQNGFSVPTDFYVQGSVHVNGNDWDVMTAKISSDNGTLKAEYGGTGWGRVWFDDPGSSKKDIAAGIYVYQDEVYVAAQVARKCQDGIGVAKLNGASGGLVTAFGGTGKVVFGGQGSNAPVCIGGNNRDVPLAVSATGGRIGVVGYGNTQLVSSVRFDPMLAVVNAVDGSLLDFARHPGLRADGSRIGDGVLYSVYGGASPSSPFNVAGDGRDLSAGNTMSFLSGKYSPASLDRIFADGFGN